MNGSSEEPGKLFIGGLSWETTQDNLQRFFSRYGEVIDCVVMKNNETGRSRGFGFVTFKDPECVNIVLSGGPHELDGRTIDPKSCNPRGTTTSKAPSSSGKVRTSTTASSKGGNFPKVFLGGLPSSVTETDLRMFFSKYGKVIEVVIMYDQERKKSRGFGFLSFDNEDSVDRVCLEHYVTVNGKQVECKRAEPRDSGGKRSGGGGGGSMGGGGGSWGNSNMMGGGNSGGWGGPMGQGGPSGGMSGQQGMGMANGMMSNYQGGWSNSPQPQAAPYQGAYGSNYQGWANQSGFNPYAAGSATGGMPAAAGSTPQSQYSQPGYTLYGAAAAGFTAGYGGGGFNNQMGGNQPQMGGSNGQMGANPSSGMSNDAYGQQGSTQAQNNGGGGGGGQQGAGAAVKSEYSGYDFGKGYSQEDAGQQSSGSRNTKSGGGGYHPYQRS